MSDKTCNNCGRLILVGELPRVRSHKPIETVVIQHQHYGCDTGCCGHRAIAFDKDGYEVCESGFDFSHPHYSSWGYPKTPETIKLREDEREQFAIEMAGDLLKDGARLDLENSEISDD